VTLVLDIFEVFKCCIEVVYYGPPPPISLQTVALSYSEHGGAIVVQVDIPQAIIVETTEDINVIIMETECQRRI